MLLRAGLALVFLLAWPAVAEASVFCVGTTGATCTITSAGTAANLQSALTSAQGGGADTVRIGPGTYTAPSASGFTYNANEKISIDGSGDGETILQGNGGPANATALDVDANSPASSTVSDLGVRKSGSVFPYGLRLTDATATDVAVTETGVDAGAGVFLEGDAVLNEATVTNPATGVDTFGTGNVIFDSVISASIAVDASAPGAQVAVRKSELRGGFQAGGSLTHTIENSVVRVGGPGAVTGLRILADGTLNASHVTVVRTPPGAGYGVQASESVAGDSSTVNLENSIVDGFSTDLRAEASAGSATVNGGWSNYATFAETGGGNITDDLGPSTNLDPKFVDRTSTFLSPGFNFRLRWNSPLIDSGKPGFSVGLDRDFNPRVVDGDGNGTATRDKGAYEYQRRAPTAGLVGPGSGKSGQSLAFKATGSSDLDAGDPLTYAWSFGDGAGASGSSVSHAWSMGGSFPVKLTVSDPTGLTDTATKQVTIAPPPTSPQLQPANAAPAISRLRVARRIRKGRALPGLTGRRRGHSISFTLSEDAEVTLSLERRLSGRRVRRRGKRVCVRLTRRNRRARRCTRHARVRTKIKLKAKRGANKVVFRGRLSRRRALKPGSYRLTVNARDSGGLKAKPTRAVSRLLPTLKRKRKRR